MISLKSAYRRNSLLTMSVQMSIRTVGTVSAIAVLLVIGYLLYDKNQFLSGVFLTVGLLLVVIYVAFEIYFKKQRHDAPWQYR